MAAYRVLLVDGDERLLQTLHDAFMMARYEVVLASDGFRAVECARYFLPDLMITERNLQKLNGYQVCRLIRETPTLADLPIFLITNADTPQDRRYAAEIGVTEYLVKPVGLRELLLLAATTLRGRKLRPGRPPLEADATVQWAS